MLSGFAPGGEEKSRKSRILVTSLVLILSALTAGSGKYCKECNGGVMSDNVDEA